MGVDVRRRCINDMGRECMGRVLYLRMTRSEGVLIGGVDR